MPRQIKPRLVISTVGTSLLTNQIDSESEPDWASCLQDTANRTQEEIKSDPNVAHIIQDLKQRAKNQLEEANTIEIREASAELNGIYGLYDDQLEKGKLDHHVLITTDTAQGQVTANIVEEFLRNQKVSVEVYTPEKLSTANNKFFNQGIDNLLDWLDRRVKEDKDNYEIYFNLVGGFKALQGCMNTMGMFYADKIIYVFEGASSNLITIPRLPITVDYSRLTAHVPTLALLDAGAGLLPSKTKNIPEAMIAEIDGKMTISNWGQLIWNQCKNDFLSQALQEFPRISYDEGTFKKDYDKISNYKERVKLQETLAQVSGLLEESNGDTRDLVKSVSYSPYKGAKDKEVYHFYVGIHWRVSCKLSNGNLTLRYYGTHDYVEGKEIYK
jgi:putative CRISPR-associated protein (TIGR02619 family)